MGLEWREESVCREYVDNGSGCNKETLVVRPVWMG
jgi:hypothetical protein